MKKPRTSRALPKRAEIHKVHIKDRKVIVDWIVLKDFPEETPGQVFHKSLDGMEEASNYWYTALRDLPRKLKKKVRQITARYYDYMSQGSELSLFPMLAVLETKLKKKDNEQDETTNSEGVL